MNIFNFLQSKLQQKPQVVTQQQAKAAMGSKEQAEMLSKFGVVTDDLRMALQANDLINFERCLAGDTRIKLLDNTTPTIREMAEHPELYIGRYVVSINPTSLDLEPDKIVGVKQTVKNAELVRVTLDDDHYVDCTLDHRFLLRDGTYREAQYLQPLDSLMPFYVRFTEGKNPLHQYLQAYRPGLNRWIYLHRLVPAFFGAILGKGITVHHKNFKKEDNDPSNLQVMTTPEHRALHALLARKRPEGIKVCPICKEEFVTTLYLENPELEFIYCGRECWAKSKEKDLVTLICEVCERPFKTTCSAASYRKTCSVKCASVAKSTDETLRAIEEKPFTTCPICKKEFPTTAQLLTYCSQKCYWESKKGKAPWNKGLKAESDERVARARDRSLATKVRRREEARVLLNHKVLKVERLSKREDTYDLQTERNHNFPLAIGVFVHNSSLYTSIDRCFTGDTKVALLDGRDVSMLDLIKEYESGKVNYVYSVDLENKKIVRSPIAWAGKTGTLPIMEVVLDNDEAIRCTLDHKFMLRDGTYKRAKDLAPGESLMPLYRKIQEKGRYSEGRYFLYDPFSTHTKVQYLYFNPPYPNRPKHSVVHHAFANFYEFDKNILDDTPENHQIITKAEHTEIHRKLCRKGGENWVIRLKTENYEKYLEWCKKIGITRKANHVQSYNKGLTKENCVGLQKASQTLTGRERPEEVKRKYLVSLTMRNDNCTREEAEKRYDLVRTGVPCPICGESMHPDRKTCSYECKYKMQSIVRKGKRFNYNPPWNKGLTKETDKRLAKVSENWGKKAEVLKNHKVKSIKFLNVVEDVYDITIYPNHNFALTAGVFVSNSLVHPLMNAAPSLYADCSGTYNRIQNATVWVTAKSKEYQYQIEKMLEIINIEECIYDWLWSTATFGDLFVEIHAEPGLGIVSVNDDAHPISTSRIDYQGRLTGFYSTPGGYNTSAERNLLPPWDYVHFRLLGSKRRRPQYGGADSNYCLTGDTRIHLLDGTSPTIKEMAENVDKYVGKAIWSVNLETGRQEEDEIVEVKKTRLNAELVRVTLNNGEQVRCTPEHRFLLRDRTYVEAQNLIEGEQLRAYDSKGNSWVAFRNGVRKVEKLDERADTYDLEVKKNHNFPIKAGVFIKNSEFRTVSIMAPDVRRLTSKYGTSVLADALPIFKRLRLAEDSILMARITRGVLRNIWKIGISKENGNNEAVNSIIDGYVATLKEARSLNIDVNNPSYNSKFNAMANIEDIIIPVWGDVNQVECTKIGGDVDIKWIEDVDLLTKQLSTALAVPLPLLSGYAESANGGIGQNSLEKLDIRFARQSRRIQRAIIVGLTRMAQIHLAWQGISPDVNQFQIHMSETSTAEELEIQEALDKGLDVTGKLMEMLEAVLGPDLNKKAALEYVNEKFLKLNDLEIDKLILKGNPNAFNVSKGEDTLGGLGAAPASDSSSNPFLSHAPSGESTGGETPAPSTAPEGESEVKEEPAEEEKNPFKENLSISDLRSMVPLKESRDKWDAQWGHIRVKIIKKD